MFGPLNPSKSESEACGRSIDWGRYHLTEPFKFEEERSSEEPNKYEKQI